MQDTTDVVNTMCILQQALVAKSRDRHEPGSFVTVTPFYLASYMPVTRA